MTKIVLVRHGETEWNAAEIFRGRADVDLNETGIRQAHLLSDYLSSSDIAAVYSSPLQRALKTAQIIAAPHKLEVKIAPLLADLDYGEWEGLSHEEVKSRYPQLYREWYSYPEKVRLPRGETLDMVRDRALPFAREVVAKRSGTAVLVTHRVVLKVLICALLGIDNGHFWNLKVDTGSITTFEHDNDHFVLGEHNNTCYLSPLKRGAQSDF